jgi:hypothetical protein
MQWDVRDVLAHVQQLVERTPVTAAPSVEGAARVEMAPMAFAQMLIGGLYRAGHRVRLRDSDVVPEVWHRAAAERSLLPHVRVAEHPVVRAG